MDINNEKQFEDLINNNHALIMKVCLMFQPDPDGRDDLFQDICINVWKALPHFEGRSSISTWLYRIAINTALFQKRKNQKEPLNQASEIDDIPVYDPEDSRDRVNALYAGIDQLKASEKAIILLYLEEKSYEEIAEIIGISTGNVSVKLVRIKRKLESEIKSYLVKRGQK